MILVSTEFFLLFRTSAEKFILLCNTVKDDRACTLSDRVYLKEIPHREITLIELQSLVVFGCTALLFMVGATASTHDREEGWDDFLFVYTE